VVSRLAASAAHTSTIELDDLLATHPVALLVREDA
jgi:hypothetical protein